MTMHGCRRGGGGVVTDSHRYLFGLLVRIDAWGDQMLEWLAAKGLAHSPDGTADYARMIQNSFS